MRKAYLTRRPSEVFGDPFFRGFDELFKDELLPRSFFGRAGNGDGGFVPAVDVREGENEFVFTAELPGLTSEDVSITLDDNVLTLAGERKLENEENREQFHRIERRYGSFTRSFTLPHEVDDEQVAATFTNGVLTITVPKTEKAKPRQIEIG